LGDVDLHLHTTISDGTLTPAALVRRAVSRGLKYIAITDHDTVAGISQALVATAEFPGLTCIPGVEISTEIESGEVHILGYFVDYRDEMLNRRMRQIQESRRLRAERMITKLDDLGLSLDIERVYELAGVGSIGRPHIATAMLEKGYIREFAEAFTKYIGRDGPAYVAREKVTPAEAVCIIQRARGLPVLAHPCTVREVASLVAELAQIGLVGIEAYYVEHGVDQVTEYLNLAQQHDLIVTGGTDFHGIATRKEPDIGEVCIPSPVIPDLMARAAKHGLRIPPPVGK
jgi:predicted metal-dependent phosphoesterase TrpH